jgi:hypothetical protein
MKTGALITVALGLISATAAPAQRRPRTRHPPSKTDNTTRRRSTLFGSSVAYCGRPLPDGGGSV